MKIAIDMSPIIYGTGVSKYRENLVRNLLKIDNQNEYLLYGGSLRQLQNLKSKIQDIIHNSSNAKSITYPIPPRLADILWNSLHILPIEKVIGEFDVLHTSDWSEPPTNLPKVTTIHDLVPLVLPKYTPRIIVDTHRERLKWVKKESQRIIVPSQATKDDMVKLGFDQDKINVIYEAPNLKRAKDWQVERVLRKYSIREDYIISIGTNPRKNIEKSIEAYHLAKYGKNLKYLIVGESKNYENIDHKGVRFLGYVPDEDLAPLLTGSKLLLFASLYEGFGVPILESFECGVPVVTSNISSMPEAAGGAAVLVDPNDIGAIAEGIKVALSKPKTLITKGLKVVANYSWQKNAKETLEVYKEVL